MSLKYNKYRTFYLPQEIVDFLFITAHVTPITGNKDSEIITGLSVINEILSKSHYHRSNDDYPFHCTPMDSRYLQVKYGYDYKRYIQWLDVHNIIWHDEYYEGKTTYFYLQDINTYNFIKSQLLKLTDKSVEEILYTYCLRDKIVISHVSIDSKGIEEIKKNRIYNNWYQIKVPITKSNKKYLTRDYEEDSTYINNAPKHIKKMGGLFRKNLDIRYDEAILHANTRYQQELDKAKSLDEQNSAFKRYSSRVSSINGIKNGRNNKTLRFRRNDTNARLDTNLTNMASDLRPFIVGYENMAYLDLSNSQPVLFNILLNKYRQNASKRLLDEMQRYNDLTVNGTWYDWMIKVFDVQFKVGDEESYKAARDKCKNIWMLIAYSENKAVKHYKKVFIKEFPSIYSIIKDIKNVNYAQFAIALQKIESEIFIDEICKELVKEGIIPYTMHDGLLVPKEHKDKSYDIMATVLKKHLGLVPKIKVE